MKFLFKDRLALDGIPGRRYDLDWLRVCAFGLLIFYHIGMVYVERWGYHVKSTYLSSKLESIMLLTEPWRMAILWFISGVAIRFVLAKVSLGRFLTMRSIRLLLPLLFAIWVIVPPQLFCEMTQKGDLSVSYLEFYKAFFDLNHPMFAEYQPGIWPHVDVNHLWYLRELWVFSILILILVPLLNSPAMEWLIQKCSSNRVLLWLLFGAPVIAIQLLIEENRESLGLFFLVAGYVIAWRPKFWENLKGAKFLPALMLISYVGLIVLYNVFYGSMDEQSVWIQVGSAVWYALTRVIWLLGILRLGTLYLNRNNAWLGYLNEGVYPFYILHQSVLIVLGFWLSSFQLGPVVEPLLVIVGTMLGCYLGFEVIRRVPFLRPLFGLKLEQKLSPTWVRLGYVVGLLAVIPIAAEILI